MSSTCFRLLLLISFLMGYGVFAQDPVQQLPHYKVTSILAEPFLMEKEDKSLKGNDRYEGFCKDLADMIADRLNFTYDLHLVQDKMYGTQREGRPDWTGMVGEVQRGQVAQIGIAPITTTQGRMKVVDFSSPFLEFQLGILMKDPDTIDKDGDGDVDEDDKEDEDEDEEGDYHGQFIFLRPMHWALWIVFIVASLVTVGALFIVERIISNKIYEAKLRATVANNLPPIPPPIPIGLCRNGVVGSPRSGTGRLLQVIFWIFIVLFLAAYIATFAADRVVDRLDVDTDTSDIKLKSIEDILEQDEVHLGVLRSGSSYEYLKVTKDRTYRKIWSLINANKGFTQNSEEGVERVRKSNGTYAFIMEAPVARSEVNQKPCDLMMAPELFGPKRGYSIITHPGMPITREINLAILAMKEDDQLEDLEDKWFEDKSECEKGKDGDDTDDDDDDDEEEAEDHDPLCLADMAGIFYLLILAIFIALIVTFLEIRHYSQPRTQAQTLPLR